MKSETHEVSVNEDNPSNSLITQEEVNVTGNEHRVYLYCTKLRQSKPSRAKRSAADMVASMSIPVVSR